MQKKGIRRFPTIHHIKMAPVVLSISKCNKKGTKFFFAKVVCNFGLNRSGKYIVLQRKLLLISSFFFIHKQWKSHTKARVIVVQYICVQTEIHSTGGSRVFLRLGSNSQSRCANQFFCRKLHENERIWTPEGRSLDPPPMHSIKFYVHHY